MENRKCHLCGEPTVDKYCENTSCAEHIREEKLSFKEELGQKLSQIFTDIIKLKEGTWIPDSDSCDATLDNIENIGKMLDSKVINLDLVKPKKPFQLPRVFAEKWMAALRSGRYEQETGFLFRKNYPSVDEDIDTTQQPISQGFCCLGIAALACGLTEDDIEDKEMLVNEVDPNELGKNIPKILFEETINKGHRTMVGVLINLNDSTTQYGFNQDKKAFPGLIYREQDFIKTSTSSKKMDFKGIANFIEDNTDLI